MVTNVFNVEFSDQEIYFEYEILSHYLRFKLNFVVGMYLHFLFSLTLTKLFKNIYQIISFETHIHT